MKQLTLRALCYLLVCVLLAGCGFHLRDQAGLPAAMDQTYLQMDDPRGELARALRVTLAGNGAQITGERDEATAILSVPMNRLTKQVLSVGTNARAREFELIYIVTFELTGADGKTIMPLQRLELRRDYTFDEQQVLGTTGEEALLRRDLRRDMVRLMLLRLEAFSNRT